MSRALSAVALAATCLVAACAAAPRPLDEEHLAAELQQRPIVLLGEVHDNPTQHAIRQRAIARFLQSGARPVIAFEQFDYERQTEIERARGNGAPDRPTHARQVIDAARTPGDNWNWDHYRPLVELALQYDLPIIAANLSRATAARIAREGYSVAFAEAEMRALGLDRVDEHQMKLHEAVVDEAHCHLLPSTALRGLARAQIARDAVLARSIRQYAERGVVLLTGNGHVRRDLGVPRHLSETELARTWAIGLLETDADAPAAAYDAVFVSNPPERDDPCRQVLPAKR